MSSVFGELPVPTLLYQPTHPWGSIVLTHNFASPRHVLLHEPPLEPLTISEQSPQTPLYTCAPLLCRYSLSIP
jgi:hypothetical protein